MSIAAYNVQIYISIYIFSHSILKLLLIIYTLYKSKYFARIQ